MRKYLLVTLLASFFCLDTTYSQVGIGINVGPGYGYGPVYRRPYPRYRPHTRRDALPKFDPVVHFSVGYGFPNLDASQFAGFYNYYRGPVSQTGPFTASLDYQYSRTSSIGIMATHGKANASYYDYNNPSAPAVLSGSLDNWSILLNLMNYLPVNGGRVAPYFRTAIGVNIWDQQYTDASGGKLGPLSNLPQLAYQVSLGTNINFSKNSGLFLEAGYGKYIVQAGLHFRL
ncbi:MAG: hypothetical protein V4450_11790 [Bacteroidota bacterium]